MPAAAASGSFWFGWDCGLDGAPVTSVKLVTSDERRPDAPAGLGDCGQEGQGLGIRQTTGKTLPGLDPFWPPWICTVWDFHRFGMGTNWECN